MPAQVVDRHIFYEGSAWGDTIASDKSALLPGQTATFANYISYNGGIRGLFVDVEELANPGAISAADFRLIYGNDNKPAFWPPANAPDSVNVSEGAGVGDSDRIELIWNATAIPNSNWLAVTVLANAHTGLLTDDVHYWGLAIGETGNSDTDTFVNAADIVVVDENWDPIGPVPIDNPADLNRDKTVSVGEYSIITNNWNEDPETCLQLITPTIHIWRTPLSHIHLAGDRQQHVHLAGGRQQHVHLAGDRQQHVYLAGDQQQYVHLAGDQLQYVSSP